MNNPIPEYLYHYTTIENLALILKNHTIRLNSLDKMDDLQEQKTADVENLGKFVFVSSWTEDQTESIPMWKMYTNLKSGVRIKLKSNPFVHHGTRAEDIEMKFGMQRIEDSQTVSKIDTFLDLTELMARGFFSPQAWGGDILEKVQYTDENDDLVPNVSQIEDGKIHLELNKLGKFKNQYWSFQSEWRYIMIFMRFNYFAPPEISGQLFTISVNNMLRGTELPPFSFYDLEIAPRFFEEMEITMSPQMTPGNKIALQAIVEKYNPSAKIVQSELLGLI